jgi:photosystem II stability/assembly factor-like uncharacterized protein
MKHLFSLLLIVFIAFCFNSSSKKNFFEKEGREHSPGEPYEEFMLQRTYPNKTFDVNAYKSALESAKLKSQQQLRSGLVDTWTMEGPENIGGRFNCIAVDPLNADIMYAGSANGGVWKTTDNGTNWFPVSDNIPYLAIGAITINPNNANEIWIGTGDVNISGTMYMGNGIYKSMDAGQSWNYTGLANTFVVSSIIFNPANSDEVLIATMGNSFSRDSNRGIYKTTDGGNNFTLVNFVNDSTGFIDMIQDPVHPSTIYASSFSRIRTDWVSLTMGTEVYIYKSTDFGQTWNILGGGLPNGNLHERLGISLCRNSPDVLYAFYSTSDQTQPELYKSTDAGQTWSQVNIQTFDMTSYGTYGWYFGKIYVDPQDPDLIYIPAIDLLYSTDGGENWNSRTPPWFFYEVHGDGHYIHFNSSDDFIYCTDGGMYRTTDAGNNWTDIENIPNNQFYSIAENPNNPGEYAGGVQDNGTMFNNSGSTAGFSRLYGGDGFTVAYTSNPMMIYAESQYGNIVFDDMHPNGNWNTVQTDNTQQYNWHTPYFLSSFGEDTMFIGGEKVMRIDGAPFGTFINISPVLVDTLSSTRVQNISTINQSILDRNILYAGTADGRVWNTLDGGNSWNNITPFQGNPFYITRVLTSHTDPSTAYVSRSGYRSNDFTPLIFKTSDNGISWQNISGDLPLLAINDIVVYPLDENIIFIANDAGVYGSNNGGLHWDRVGTNMPYVAVMDIDLNFDSGKIIAGTFGRSIYSIDITNIVLGNGITIADKNVSVYPNPSSSFINVRSQKIPDDITVYSANGQLMTRTKNVSVNVSSYPEGTYFVKINLRNSTIVKRFLKM